MTKRWSDLTTRQRTFLVVVAAVETVLKIVMLIDLRKRPAEQVRGPKGLWAATALLGTAGLAPLTYLVFGRRREP
jgi:hypothetical protein